MFAYHSALHEPGQDVGHVVLVVIVIVIVAVDVIVVIVIVVVDIALTHLDSLLNPRSRHVKRAKQEMLRVSEFLSFRKHECSKFKASSHSISAPRAWQERMFALKVNRILTQEILFLSTYKIVS